MLRRKKTRLASILFATVVMLSVGITAFSPMVKADEYQGGYASSQNVDGGILDHQLYFYLLSCFYQENVKSIDDDKIAKWQFIDNSGGEERVARGAMYSNVAPECSDGPSMQEAFGRFGFTDPVDTFCSLSFTYNTEFGGNGKSGTAGKSKEACLAGRDQKKNWDGVDGSNARTTQRNAVEALLATSDKAAAAKGFEDYQQYVRSYRSLMNGCSVYLSNEYGSGAAAGNDKKRYKVSVVSLDDDGKPVSVDWLGITRADPNDKPDWDEDGVNGVVNNDAQDVGTDGWRVPLVATRGGDSTPRTCGQLAQDTGRYAAAYVAYLEEHPDEAIENGTDPNETGEIDLKCAGFSLKNAVTLEWVICPLVQGMMDMAGQLEDGIAGMLCINEAEIFAGSTPTCAESVGNADSGTAFRDAWSVFRTLALGILAIGGLVMIISQALGFEVFDAYTIKKVLPRILIAGIGITLSWPLLEFLVRFSNVLGIGIRGLIYAPFVSSGVANVEVLNGGAAALTAIFAAGSFVALGVIGLLSFVATAALAILIAFFVLIIRNILVIFLIIAAPLAIAMYILPNTEKYWKLWWDWFWKALLAFPIITGMIAIGHVFAAITAQNGNGMLETFVSFAAYFAPYFLIPAAFRFAGGALSTIGGFTNDRSRGAFDRLSKFRQGQTSKNWDNIKAGKRWQGNPVGERLSRTLQTGSLAGEAGYNPAQWRSRTQAARSSRISAMSAEAEKDHNVRAVMGNDDLLNASLHGNRDDASARTYLEGLGQRGQALEQNVASVRAARRAMGRQAYEDFAAANIAGTGTGYGGGPAEMFETINRVAGTDRARATRMLASARGQAERAKRIDLTGAGFGTSADQLEQMYNGTATRASVNEVMTDEALNAKSSYEIAASRNGALVNMVPAVQRRLARAEVTVTNARATGNAATIQVAEHEYKRVLAATAGMHDVAGNTSPENAQITGALMGQVTSIPHASNATGTVLGNIEVYRSDPEFQQYRKEYATATVAAAAGAAGAAAGAPGAGGAPPPGGAPGGAPPSDVRLKRDVHYLKTTTAGIRLYSFRYIWGGPTYVGVMAQEILESHPSAVITAPDGYYRVDYSQLGLEMKTLEDWVDTKSTKDTNILTF